MCVCMCMHRMHRIYMYVGVYDESHRQVRAGACVLVCVRYYSLIRLIYELVLNYKMQIKFIRKDILVKKMCVCDHAWKLYRSMTKNYNISTFVYIKNEGHTQHLHM